MIWYEDLFLGESITERRKKRIIRGVKKRSFFSHAYLLTLPTNPDNLMDLISTGVLRQKHYPKKGLFVIGIAADYDEALLLAGRIVAGIYAAQGNFNLGEFFRRRPSADRKDGPSC